MAAAFLKFFDNELEVYSAGISPAAQIHPKSVIVMKDVGIDISTNSPQSVDKFINQSFDFVITVCDHARETCPLFLGEVKHRLHIGFEDPAAARGTEEEIVAVFCKVRDEIKSAFYSLYLQRIKGE
jgi:arsenate reductase